MAKNKKSLKIISRSKVRIFKIENRKGFAAVCMNNLTEGGTVNLALERMNKALKRSGYTIKGYE